VIRFESTDRWSTAPRIYHLWAGVLLAPLAWALHLGVGYALSAAVCTPPTRWPFFLLSGAAFAVAGTGGWIAWRVRRDTGDEPEDAPDARARGRFMTVAGILLSVMFLLAIAAQTIPMFLLEPCRE
jgi:hypothetical protein